MKSNWCSLTLQKSLFYVLNVFFLIYLFRLMDDNGWMDGFLHVQVLSHWLASTWCMDMVPHSSATWLVLSIQLTTRKISFFQFHVLSNNTLLFKGFNSVSTLQNQSDRKSKQRRRHKMVDLLGGVRRLQCRGVLLRHFPLLVSFLLCF